MCGVADSQYFDSKDYILTSEVVTKKLNYPWGMAFLPNGNILVTELTGQLRLIKDGQLHPTPIGGLPEVAVFGQGGLLDIALHPDFADNQWLYLSYSAQNGKNYGTEVIRARLQGMQLIDIKTIFHLSPKSPGGHHFGSRLLFMPNGKLIITLGDRANKKEAQNLTTHIGSIIRVNDDGSVPEDNPFTTHHNSVKSEIYTYGNRNVQGIALDKQNRLWAHEHGPQGGDEVNLIKSGVNYGWPVITYGVNYLTGTKIGIGTEKKGMAQPIHYWVPSIAPSGMMFYDGDEFEKWQDNMLVGSLKFGQLVRLVIKDDKVISEERLINGELGRIRNVRQAPDGTLYLLTDERNGRLIRLRKIDQ